MQDLIPPELKDILLLSLLNPGTIVGGYMLGRRADERSKIVIAAFGAGVAGAAFGAVAPWVGLTVYRPSLLVGIFVTSFVFGFWWAWLGYRVREAKNAAHRNDA
jgi:hypothetical protein